MPDMAFPIGEYGNVALMIGLHLLLFALVQPSPPRAVLGAKAMTGCPAINDRIPEVKGHPR